MIKISAEIVYNKLVRDKIPHIIEAANKQAITYVATEEEMKPMLLKKLIEELEEFKDTPNEEEFADILEVIDGIARAYNYDMEKVLKLKTVKKEQRGGFERGVILQKVIE